MIDPVYLTPDEVADLLRCKPEKIYRMCAAHDRGEDGIPSVRFGARRLIKREALDAYLESLAA